MQSSPGQPRDATDARVTAGATLERSGKLKSDVVAARLGDRIVDLHTPVPEGAELEPVRVSDADGLAVIRHSTAHVMADAVQKLFPGTQVTIGPAIEDGFYYDFDRPSGAFSEDELAQIEEAMRKIVEADSPFRREVIARDDALRLFEEMGEEYKCDIIRRRPEGEELTLYRHGATGAEWVDFCAGPHVPSTRFLAAFKLTSVAGAYWRGDERNPMLQRIYGTAFPSEKALTAHLKRIEEAKARDHRKLGKELDLFFFSPLAPAMPFFLPKGASVYNRLVDYIRGLYDRYGYEEVITPQAFDPELFRTSGHLGNYNDNMYRLWTEDQFDSDDSTKASGGREVLADGSFALKPMNCPSHCVIFGSRKRSYRELPWRIADFGRLHRYERGGVVHGLARVRTFCQDDAHIFCTEEQVPDEIASFIKMLYEVYRAFEFERVDVKLATRPDKRIGSDEEWDRAESALAEGLRRAGIDYELAEGEGAFYGPKVEFHVLDALKRSWQLGTIQLDRNLPSRFELGYIAADGHEHQPIMLHRAVFGSLERFFGVFLEHCGGSFPTWIAPTQATVLTVTDRDDAVNAYAGRVLEALGHAGIRASSDLGPDKLGAKIRAARLARVPYACVIGKKEAEGMQVAVRSRDAGELGPMALEAFIERVKGELVPGVRAREAGSK